jgi:hypothetical protein
MTLNEPARIAPDADRAGYRLAANGGIVALMAGRSCLGRRDTTGIRWLTRV